MVVGCLGGRHDNQSISWGVPLRKGPDDGPPSPNNRASRASCFPSAVLKITFAELLRSFSCNVCCGVCGSHAAASSNPSLVPFWVIYSSDVMSCRAYGDAPMQQRPPLIGSRRGGFLARAPVCGAYPWVLGILLCGTPRASLWKPESRSRVLSPYRRRPGTWYFVRHKSG